MGLIYADIELINSDDLALLRRGYIGEDQVKKIIVNNCEEINIICDSLITLFEIINSIKLKVQVDGVIS